MQGQLLYKFHGCFTCQLYKQKNHLSLYLQFVRIGQLPVRPWFGTVETLSVDVLIWTSFIARWIGKIFPLERNVVLGSRVQWRIFPYKWRYVQFPPIIACKTATRNHPMKPYETIAICVAFRVKSIYRLMIKRQH